MAGPSSPCCICHRPLRDPDSVRLGIGPVCRGKSRERPDAGMMRAHYTYRVDGAAVWITDQDIGRTVTNDAENVIADLARLGLLDTHRIFYRDTLGRWDELVHEDGRFIGFQVMPASFLPGARP